MLNLFDMLNQSQSGQGMEALARQFNLSQQQTQAAVEALLPAFSQGLKQNASDPYGIGAFVTALASGQHAKYFENPMAAFSPQGVQEGNGILGHILGSKDVSRQVAARASAQTGIGADVLQKMLPLVATLAMGALARQTAGRRASAAPADSGVLGMLTPLLDSNKDGSVTDDVMGMLGKFLR